LNDGLVYKKVTGCAGEKRRLCEDVENHLISTSYKNIWERVRQKTDGCNLSAVVPVLRANDEEQTTKTRAEEKKMRATIILLVLVVSLTVSGLVLEHTETAESMGRAEAKANEQSERYEASQINGASQYTAVWALSSLGAF
jgi:hypothetical protein